MTLELTSSIDYLKAEKLITFEIIYGGKHGEVTFIYERGKVGKHIKRVVRAIYEYIDKEVSKEEIAKLVEKEIREKRY